MKKIYNMLTIEEWKTIASYAQNLEIKKPSDRATWDHNVELLAKGFKKAGICANRGKNYPEQDNEIGVYSLLQSIYNAKSYGPETSLEFTKSIAILDALGIKKIQYCPTQFPKQYRIRPQCEVIDIDDVRRPLIHKVFTDGYFQLQHNLNTSCDMLAIKDANFLLSAETTSISSFVHFEQGTIFVKDYFNFDFSLPNKKEIMSISQPSIMLDTEQKLGWTELPFVRESFEKYDSRDNKEFVKSYNSIIKK